MNYQQTYDSIIEKARSENRMKGKGVYYEAHHIIPKCMGGEGKTTQWRTHPNIVLLTAEEHFNVHKLLVDIYPDNSDLIYAYWLFLNGTNSKNHKGNQYYNIDAKEYERIRILQAELSKNRIGENHPLFNTKMSEDAKKKMRENHADVSGKNNPMFGKTGKNSPLFGRLRPEISIKQTGENNQRAKKVICSVTGRIYGCVKDAAKDIGVNYSTLYGWLRGRFPNKTSLRFL